MDDAMSPGDPAWVPAHVRWAADGPQVDWCHLGNLRFSDPFFAYTIRRAMAHPFNLLFRHATPLDALDDRPPELRLGGLIFHTTHCGSTLIVRMLASLARNVVLSEPKPLDQILRNGMQQGCEPDRIVHWLRTMVAALGRRRSPHDRDLFIKLDGWHVLLLPFFRRAFPNVPWIFVYREPLAVLSAMAQAFPAVEHWMVGLSDNEAAELSTERYCARILDGICQAALRHYDEGGGVLVEHRELPDAVYTKIAEHFGMDCGVEERARMAEIARFDAKQPQRAFVDDGEAKQRNASMESRELAASVLAPLYARLEGLRLGTAG
jgi:hypothetical protein